MTQEEKQILLADLCARLPYGVKGIRDYTDEVVTLHFIIPNSKRPNDKTGFIELEFTNLDCCPINEFRPYLRLMDNMTEDEKKEYRSLLTIYNCGGQTTYWDNYKSIDWLNKHHFDFRHLIPMGLALEAKEGMHKQS